MQLNREVRTARCFTPLETVGRQKKGLVFLAGFSPLQTVGKYRRDLVFVTGFTFIELLVVILIIGILVGVSLPSLKGTLQKTQLNSFAREVQSFMNYLHQCAIVEGKIVTFWVKNDSKLYGAEIIIDKDNPDKNWVKKYPIPEGIGIEVVKKNNTENPDILFYPDGNIDKVTLTITVGGSSKNSIALTTEGVFGGVKLQTKK